MTSRLFCAVAWGALVLGGATNCLAAFPPVALKPISLSQLTAPVAICNAGDRSSRLFVCEQTGRILIISDGMLLPTPFLDLTAELVALSSSYDERGLLSMAFHPNFSAVDVNHQPLPGYGRFYVFYSAPSPNAPGTAADPVNCRTTISEFQVSATDANVADPTSERVVLSFDKPQSNHNGGQLQFGPDGFLYASVGDGGGQHDNQAGHTGGSGSASPGPSGVLGNAQDKTRLLGKILRIDPLGTNGPGGQYGIPIDNPFVGAGSGIREEIYAYGVRNPWRFSFDSGPGGTNRLFEGDVGQDKVEEVNVIVSGGNYGWRLKEGTFDHDNTAPNGGLPLIDPIAQYAHQGTVVGSPPLPSIGASVTGGYVYRGSAIPALVGKYVFADWSPSIPTAAGTLLGLEETTPNNWALTFPLPVVGGNPLATRINAFGIDEQGELYIATKVSRGPAELDSSGNPTGGIYKIVAPQTGNTSLNPIKDNSMYSESPGNSNGTGGLFAGRTAQGNLRRALLAFDIAGQLPAGALVTGAQLTLHLNQTASGAQSVLLKKVTQSWGEGASSGAGAGAAATVGDVTWADRFFDPTTPTLWTTPGGTFVSNASGTATIGPGLGYYSWNAPQMAADVQSWLNAPSGNFGWIVIGNEAAQSAGQFDSRESSAELRPLLQITYATPPPSSRRDSWLRQYFPTPGTYVDDFADQDHDGITNAFEYAFATSPLSANTPGSGFQTAESVSGGNLTFTITFRRDPRAVDLTYQLQTSSDLSNWNTIVQSTAGAAPTGPGFVSETDAPGEAPVKVVTAAETLPAPAERFGRLKIIRAH